MDEKQNIIDTIIKNFVNDIKNIYIIQNIYKKITQLLDNYSIEDKIIFKKNIMNLLDDFYIKKTDLYEITKINILYLLENLIKNNNYENKLIYKKDILNYIETLYDEQIIEQEIDNNSLLINNNILIQYQNEYSTEKEYFIEKNGDFFIGFINNNLFTIKIDIFFNNNNNIIQTLIVKPGNICYPFNSNTLPLFLINNYKEIKYLIRRVERDLFDSIYNSIYTTKVNIGFIYGNIDKYKNTLLNDNYYLVFYNNECMRKSLYISNGYITDIITNIDYKHFINNFYENNIILNCSNENPFIYLNENVISYLEIKNNNTKWIKIRYI